MKHTLIALLLALFAEGLQAQDITKETIDNFNKLTWLTGTWNRTNVKPGRKAHERWEMVGSHAMKGFGVTMKEQDTAFVEKLQLVIKDNKIWYVADVAHNKAPVFFELTAIANDGFTCENPAHDFPKKIVYKLNGDKLIATISGDGKAFDYLFERL